MSEPASGARQVVQAPGDPATLIERIDALLPQTQCTRCGYEGCLPYARAIASGEAAINRCPPGGQEGADRLADLLGQPAMALDPTRGPQQPRRFAVIDPRTCIGCTLCIGACPVDAIIGAPRHMHTVIAEDCSGCDLCLPACPVDCIRMEVSSEPWLETDADRARIRHRQRAQRLVREQRQDQERLAGRAQAKLEALGEEPHDAQRARKQMLIEAAIRRARERLAQSPEG